MRRVACPCACMLLLVAGGGVFAGCGDRSSHDPVGGLAEAAGQRDAAGPAAADALEVPPAPAMLVDRAEFEGLRDHPLRMTLSEWKESAVRSNFSSRAST